MLIKISKDEKRTEGCEIAGNIQRMMLSQAIETWILRSQQITLRVEAFQKVI